MIPAWEEKFRIKLLDIKENLRPVWPYMTDHAAKNETSITMHVAGSFVDLSVFREGDQSPLTGVNGEHPFSATAENGAQLFQSAMKVLDPLLTQDFG